jgi:2-dehydro-3-deoxyphosphogluconate aldolase/(4S)-4-hydroxy-2-oxoglutarate aldolase
MDWQHRLAQHRAIAVIRAPSLLLGYEMAQAVAAGGMRFIEITADSERPWAAIERLRADLPDCAIGTGTVLSGADWQNAVSCGAEFIFSPHVDRQLIAKSQAVGIPMIPGALSPTEIVTAWQAGAAAVKVFPIQAMGGAAYLQALRGPLGQIPLIPTGGVTVANAREMLAAGAIAVGLAGALFPQAAIEQRDWPTITALARQLMDSLVKDRSIL